MEHIDELGNLLVDKADSTERPPETHIEDND